MPSGWFRPGPGCVQHGGGAAAAATAVTGVRGGAAALAASGQEAATIASNSARSRSGSAKTASSPSTWVVLAHKVSTATASLAFDHVRR
ncbi:MAG: hypothetical protein ABIP45_00770 [Knoellia sp.]